MAQPAEAVDDIVVHHHVDQRVMLHNVSWSDYEAVRAMRGDRAGVRIAYLKGTLELMTPSRDHEIVKTKLARLLEAYAEELGIELEGYGSWTLEREDLERALEPDECYSVGPAGAVPDIAIEVVWTGGGLDKLEVHRLLGVREVWVWRKGEIRILGLRGDAYERIANSDVLAQVNIDLVLSCMELPTQTAAVRQLRARLRHSR